MRKPAIVRSILEAERSSKLATMRGAARSTSQRSTWFARSFKMLAEACDTSQVESLRDKLTMVNFNYYRCVEHFLVQAIRVYFGLDEGRA